MNCSSSLYLVEDDEIEVIVSSNTNTRNIILNPEICGPRFQNILSLGLKEILKHIIDSGNTKIANEFTEATPLDVIYILRGGLNFNLHNIVSEIDEDKNVEVSFISSQRVAKGDGFVNEEDSYKKWSIQNNSMLMIGDISATGGTLKFISELAIGEYLRLGVEPKRLFIVTIGTFEALNAVKKINKRFLNKFSEKFEGTTVLFLEGIFTLNKTQNVINLPNTDFFPKGNHMAPELMNEIYKNPGALFERCIIYDGGSRAFEPNLYLRNVLSYYLKLLNYLEHSSIEQILETKTSLLADNNSIGTNTSLSRIGTYKTDKLFPPYPNEVEVLSLKESLNKKFVNNEIVTRIRKVENILKS